MSKLGAAGAVVFSTALFLGVAAHSNDGAAREIYVPVGHSLWRVAADGSAKVQAFRFEGGELGSGSESKLSPNRRLVAFVHAGNVWTLEPISGRCTQISGFGECDPDSSGCYGVTLYGWTPDSKNLVFSLSYADYGPGEGEPPPKFEGLKYCASTSAVAGFQLPEEDDNPDSQYKGFVINVDTAKLQRIKPVEQAPSLVYSDGAYGGAAKSPNGKFEASIRDPYAGKSEIIVDNQVALPGIKVRRFWWITDKAIAALSYSNDEKSLELRVVRIPKFKVLGTYSQARK